MPHLVLWLALTALPRNIKIVSWLKFDFEPKWHSCAFRDWRFSFTVYLGSLFDPRIPPEGRFGGCEGWYGLNERADSRTHSTA